MENKKKLIISNYLHLLLIRTITLLLIYICRQCIDKVLKIILKPLRQQTVSYPLLYAFLMRYSIQLSIDSLIKFPIRV